MGSRYHGRLLATATACAMLSAGASAEATFIGQLHISNATFEHLGDVDLDWYNQPAPLSPVSSFAQYDWEGQSIVSQHTFTPTANGFSAAGSAEFLNIDDDLNPAGYQGTTLAIVAVSFDEPTPLRVQTSLYGGDFVMEDGEIVSGTFAAAIVLNQNDPSEVYSFFNSPDGLQVVDEIIMVGPGTYELGFAAQGTWPLDGNLAWFDGSYSIVPEPGSLLLLSAMILPLWRRR